MKKVYQFDSLSRVTEFIEGALVELYRFDLDINVTMGFKNFPHYTASFELLEGTFFNPCDIDSDWTKKHFLDQLNKLAYNSFGKVKNNE